MSSVQVELDDELVALLSTLDQPVSKAARELIVLELYRRRVISSGKAAELLGMPHVAFIRHASQLGIAYLDMSEQEWEAERAASMAL